MVASKVNQRMVESESSLEQDFHLLLDFNYGDHILSFEEQPVGIPFKDEKGRGHKYTPDIHVIYRQESSSTNNLRSFLGEVKYRKNLFEDWKEIKPKLKAGRAYAKANDLDFRILTEKEIQTPFLKNAKLLRQYKHLIIKQEQAIIVIEALRKLGVTTPTALLRSISNDRWKQAEVIPILWHLIATARIGCDLDVYLTMERPIWPL